MSKRIAVIGAGIQGTLIALELAERGIRVDLFDRHDTVLSCASRWNEGKIHLGFIYAKDRIDRTATLMTEGAACWLPLISRFIDPAAVTEGASDRFLYAVMPDSQLTPDDLDCRYRRIAALGNEAMATFGPYLGFAGPLTAERLPRPGPDFADGVATAVFRTCERSVNVHAVADALTDAVAGTAALSVVTGVGIDAIERHADGSATLTSGGVAVGRYAEVVNAAWDQRMALDATVGIRPDRAHLHRRKVAIHFAEGAPAMPTVTLVHGPYGDVVRYGNGGLYLSWYPVGCDLMTGALAPPLDWQRPPADAVAEALVPGVIDALAAKLPAVAKLDLSALSFKVAGGVIVGWGATDIDDVNSELHTRFDVGPRSFGTYHSVDTGKYTLAPLFAHRLAQRIAPDRRALHRVAQPAAAG